MDLSTIINLQKIEGGGIPMENRKERAGATFKDFEKADGSLHEMLREWLVTRQSDYWKRSTEENREGQNEGKRKG